MDEVLDVLVVGGGFAGSALGAALATRGFRIAVCDPRDVHPQELKAEKLSAEQIALLGRIGLAAPVQRAATPAGETLVVRMGKAVHARRSPSYGLDYRVLVDALRAEIPRPCWIRRRVEAIEAKNGLPSALLTGGQRVTAKLVVLASGLAMSLRNALGLDRVMLSENHSLSIGFDLAAPPFRQAGRSLTYYAENVRDRAGYIALFPIGERLRANLFVYRLLSEDWTQAFRADPASSLDAMMPKLRAMAPPFRLATTPVLRPMHLVAPRGRVRDGIALIGDAYSTTCPAGGLGVTKALVDIERLIEVLPRWLGQGRAISGADIADYYRDPVKRASEARAWRKSQQSRALAIDPGFMWAARRQGQYYGHKAMGMLSRRRDGFPRDEAAEAMKSPAPAWNGAIAATGRQDGVDAA